MANELDSSLAPASAPEVALDQRELALNVDGIERMTST
jgi:hypothetical protein